MAFKLYSYSGGSQNTSILIVKLFLYCYQNGKTILLLVVNCCCCVRSIITSVFLRVVDTSFYCKPKENSIASELMSLG